MLWYVVTFSGTWTSEGLVPVHMVVLVLALKDFCKSSSAYQTSKTLYLFHVQRAIVSCEPGHFIFKMISTNQQCPPLICAAVLPFSMWLDVHLVPICWFKGSVSSKKTKQMYRFTKLLIPSYTPVAFAVSLESCKENVWQRCSMMILWCAIKQDLVDCEGQTNYYWY